MRLGAFAPRCLPTGRYPPLRQTFAFYLSGLSGEARFVPVTCADLADALQSARAMLAADAALASVEIKYGANTFVLQMQKDQPCETAIDAAADGDPAPRGRASM
jgi:hypothetical protein